MSQETKALIVAGIAAACVLVAYFIPTGVAWQRKHQSRRAIFILNLALGWTGLGWLVSIIWAFTGTSKEAAADIAIATSRPDNDTIACPKCAETIKRAARVCRFCGHEIA
ncbi:superinfection immunity protein [Paramagnetospirillum magnetotacticum]|uniref:superinfection immunity protein n=1 Tax=Paramagnetospirillum magnetotacticum TaxID=188 RepID=UPI0005973A4F|nr:superinfection immunity protein [Paramagnetospirillum magnetotacticum]